MYGYLSWKVGKVAGWKVGERVGERVGKLGKLQVGKVAGWNVGELESGEVGRTMVKIDPTRLSVAFSEKALCTRCGTCVGVCPVGALSLDDAFYPKLDADTCTSCGLCAKTCPGGRVDYAELAEITYGERKDTDRFDGFVASTFVGHCSDERIRGGGAGGGVITALLWDMLKRGVVDGCVVTRMNPERPWHGEAFIARTYEELLESQQSKYIVIPLNAMLQKIREQPGRYAVAGLPCHVHGLRLVQREDPALAERIHAIVGLFCAAALEPFVVEEMLACRGLTTEEVSDFKFRDGEWPGNIHAFLKQGGVRKMHRSNFKDGAINYLTYLYSPRRCQACIDGSAEFSDVSVSDAWTRDSAGNYIFKNRSKMLVRTQRGAQVIEQALASGALVADDLTDNASFKTHRLHTKKKGLTAKLRVERWQRRGKPVPEYNRRAPACGLRDRWAERMETLIMDMGQVRWIRYPLFKFLTSVLGEPFIKIRVFIKSRKYRG